MSDVVYRPDVADFMSARLAEEFRKPRTSQLVRGIGAQFQQLEDAVWQLYTLRGIDTAAGWVLDVLGKIVGERRQGSLDDDYRIRIRARIRTNLSDGTAEDVLAVMRLLLGPIVATLSLKDFYPAGFVLKVSGTILTPTQVQIFASFLRQARGAAIDAQLGYQTVPDADAFVCATSSPLTAPVLAGAVSLAVASTADFPATGTLAIDSTLPAAETVAYTGKTGTTFTLAAPLANPHPLSAMVDLPTSVGKGWGDEANAATGGQLVGIAHA